MKEAGNVVWHACRVLIAFGHSIWEPRHGIPKWRRGPSGASEHIWFHSHPQRAERHVKSLIQQSRTQVMRLSKVLVEARVPDTPNEYPVWWRTRLPTSVVHVRNPVGDHRDNARHGSLPRVYLGPHARDERRVHVEHGTEADVFRPPGCSGITRPSLCLFTTCSNLF